MPEGMVLNPITGLVDWVVGFHQADDSPYQITFTATANEQSVAQEVQYEVLNKNGVPEFVNLQGIQVNEGEEIVLRTFAFDPDNPDYEAADLDSRPGESPITYAASGLPTGAVYDAQSALLTWTPTFQQAGGYNITFTATDDGDGTGVSASSTITIPVRVLNVNRSPEFTTPTPDLTTLVLNRGETSQLPVSVIDPDGNPLVLTAASSSPGLPIPRFANFTDNGDGTGIFTFTPDEGDRGNYTIVITAADNGDDGQNATRETTFVFNTNVESLNEPPRFEFIGNHVAVVGETLQWQIRARDLDQDPLTFQINDVLPASATLTPVSAYGEAVLTWTPTQADIGTYDLSFTVTDSGNLGATPPESDNATARLVVRSTNDAPHIV